MYFGMKNRVNFLIDFWTCCFCADGVRRCCDASSAGALTAQMPTRRRPYIKKGILQRTHNDRWIGDCWHRRVASIALQRMTERAPKRERSCNSGAKRSTGVIQGGDNFKPGSDTPCLRGGSMGQSCYLRGGAGSPRKPLFPT